MASTSATIGPYVVGELPPPLVYTFLDSSGAAIDLTGHTAKFTFREADGPPTQVDAEVTGPGAGQVTYTWNGTEWPTSGKYQAEFWVGNGTNRYASILLKFDVRSAVGTVPDI